VGAEATIAALTVMEGQFDEATRQIVADAAHIIQGLAMNFAPVGTPGNSTNMPGDLRRSIYVDGPSGGGGTWFAQVGPTVIYGRQRELGGAIYQHSSRFLRFERFGIVEYRRRVYQHPEPYMKPAEAAALPDIEAVVVSRLTAVIEEG
jgi:hypothetical protein